MPVKHRSSCQSFLPHLPTEIDLASTVEEQTESNGSVSDDESNKDGSFETIAKYVTAKCNEYFCCLVVE